MSMLVPFRNVGSLGSLGSMRNDFFAPFEETFDSFFDSFWKSNSLQSIKNRKTFPKLDEYLKDSEYCIDVVVAGYEADKIDVKVDDNTVIISAKSNETDKVANENYISRGIRRSSFIHSLQLPDNVEGEPIATIENGLLSLKWKLKEVKEEATKIKKIPIAVKDNQKQPQDISS